MQLAARLMFVQRMRLSLVTTALLACSLMTTATAHAAPADGQLWEEVKIAQAYWSFFEADPCPVITPSIIDLPVSDEAAIIQMASGWSVIGSCAMALTPEFAAETRRSRSTYYALRHECAVVVHEVGHALGLSHQDADSFPIMGEEFPARAIPSGCRAWARGQLTARHVNRPCRFPPSPAARRTVRSGPCARSA